MQYRLPSGWPGADTTMATVLIETRCRRSAPDESALIEAVHRALIQAFKIQPQDNNVRLVAYEPHRFGCAPDLSEPALYTHITIDAFTGRSLTAKRALYRNIVANLAALDIPPDHVHVLLRENRTANWGIRGGQAACDVELGFEVNI